MKINLEVLYSCTIKRKKPWPRVNWIGREKEQLFILDNQRISILDAKNGKTKKKVSKLTQLFKTIVAYNVSDNGLYLVAILNSGDLIIWNRDKETIKNISGMSEFAFKLGFHCPSVFISDDTNKIILVTSRNKVFVWESDKPTDSFIKENVINGNWSDIVASKDIKTVEDNKELALHARFYSNQFEGLSATCCFVFNYENRLIINVLKIKWINQNEIVSPKQCRFETIWICHQPTSLSFNNNFGISKSKDILVEDKFNCLYTRGAYVIKLAHSVDIIALACNQKYVENNCLVFMSASNGSIKHVNLRNFGLNLNARGRHYWIQDLNWMYSDLYLAGITKHGAIFLVSRLGQPLLIHAIGKDINMGPALYLTLHPLIIVRGKSTSNSMHNKSETSLSSTIENEDNLRQRYSIARHPYLPVFACSDGYLMCIFRLQSAFSTQSRLIRELMHETIGNLNSVSEKLGKENESFYLKDQFKSKSEEDLRKSNNEENVPEWGIASNLASSNALVQSEKSSDSGVDSNDGNKAKGRSNSFGNQKIAEGKIIFSFLPQILPISDQTIRTGSVVNKMESAFEFLLSSWSLLVSMSSDLAAHDTHECDQTAKAIQQAFTHFSYLFLTIDSANLKEFQIYQQELEPIVNKKLTSGELSLEQKNIIELKYEEEFKVKVLVDLFMRMLKVLYFDPASKHNPNSHMIVYVPRLVEKFVQSLVKFENIFVHESYYALSRTNLFGLVYTILNVSENLTKSIYEIKQSNKFILNTDSIAVQKSIEAKSTTVKQKLEEKDFKNGKEEPTETKIESDTNIESDSLEKSNENRIKILIKQNQARKMEFNDLLFEKCWLNLMHYVIKYRENLEPFGSMREKQMKDLNLFIILLERRLQKFPIQTRFNHKEEVFKMRFNFIHKRSQLFKINKADLIYLDYGDCDAAIEDWVRQLKLLFEQIDSDKSKKRRNLDLNKSKTSSQYSKLIYKSIKIALKIFYACIGNYKIKKLIEIVNNFFEFGDYKSNKTNLDTLISPYTPFKLTMNTFKYLKPPKPLQRTHFAIICLIKSLARFMALYLSNRRPLFIYTINNPIMMPSIIDLISNNSPNTHQKLRQELSREKLTHCLSIRTNFDSSLSAFFTPDKVLELFLVTGLFDEAIYFLNLINDWKSSFLIGSILKESDYFINSNLLGNLPNDMICEQALTNKVCSLLGIDRFEMNKSGANSNIINSKLMEKNQSESVTLILKELLLCSVMTKTNILESLLSSMLESMVLNVEKLSQYAIIVPDDFYLPAPPIYCAQMQTVEDEANYEFDSDSRFELSIRAKLSMLCKCIIVLLTSSNLHVPLIKWYLEHLSDSSQQMKINYGISNMFKLDDSLNHLLTSIRYQKLGYIPENILFIFREFCAILFYIDLRDRFTLALRQYSKHFIQNQAIDLNNSNHHNSSIVVQLCLKIIDYGNSMLSYRAFLKDKHVELQDIIISTISRLTTLNQYAQLRDFNLEQKLAVCVEKKPLSLIETLNSSHLMKNLDEDQDHQFSMENLNNKLYKLLESWKGISSRNENVNTENTYLSMADLYEHNILANQRSSNSKLASLYGMNEDSLARVYILKLDRAHPYVCGGFDFERTYWCAEFLELFFKLGFDQTEDWEFLIQSANQTPLLPEFYDTIRNTELPDSDQIDKQYIMKPISKETERRKSDANEFELDAISPLNSRKMRRMINSIKASPNSTRKEITVEELNLAEQSEKYINLDKRQGLFRVYSVKSINQCDKPNQEDEKLESMKLKKSVSFSDLNLTENFDDLNNSVNAEYLNIINKENGIENIEVPVRNDQPLKVFDFGPKYVQTSNLAIWLIKWSFKFHRILMANTKAVGSFWNETNESIVSAITLKLNILNANLLVGCVYMADGNNLKSSSMGSKLICESKAISKKASSKSDQPDDDFTQISTSSVSSAVKQNQQVAKIQINEESSTSSTLDISSFTEGQIKNFFNKSEKKQVEIFMNNKKQKLQKQTTVESTSSNRSPSPSKSPSKTPQLTQTGTFNFNKSFLEKSLSSTFEASEFYSINNPKKINKLPPTTTTVVSDLGDTQKSINEEYLNKSERSVRMGSLEFISNMFNKMRRESSRSPNRSKSPNRPVSKSPIKQLDKPPNVQSQQQTQQSNQNMIQTSSTNSLPMGFHNIGGASNGATDVHEIIRNELRKIVQMQHDTVMNFLNNGNPQPSQSHYYAQLSPGEKNLNQQLTSILRQQQNTQVYSENGGPPVEFIIETKIKTIDSLTGQPNSVSSVFSSSIDKQPSHQQLQFQIDNQLNSPHQFAKTFEEKKTVKKISNPKSSIIKIPLLNMKQTEQTSGYIYENRERGDSPHLPNILTSPNTKVKGLKLLDFKANQGLQFNQTQVQSSTLFYSEKIAPTKDQGDVNRHVKEYIEMNTKHTISTLKNFPLLKFGDKSSQEKFTQSLRSTQASQLQTITSTKTVIPQSEQPIEPVQNIQTMGEQAKSQENKGVQIQKPLYDGYLIAPGVFEDMLKANAENEHISATSAQAHYSSTQYIRDAQRDNQICQNKRETYTMTDNLGMADPIAPDILFKLHFDASRKDRQTLDDDGINDDIKDYVNVVDLDSSDVDNILKLIEHEQNKRQGKYVSISPSKLKIIKEKTLDETKTNDPAHKLHDTDVDLKADKDEEQILKGDTLTDQILATSKEEWKEYDQIMEQQIKEANRIASGSVNRQRAVNELKYIDDKIKLMNQMANEMNSDYSKYSKIIGEVQNLNRQRQLIERYQEEQQREEENQNVRKKREQEQKEKIKFYEPKEAHDQIGDLKKKVVKPVPKPKLENKIKIKPINTDKIKVTKDKKQLDLVSFEDDDEELSDLKEGEEARLKNILKESTSLNLTKKDDSISVTNILKDVFDDMNVDTVEDLDSEKIDELLNLSVRKDRLQKFPKPKLIQKPSSLIKPAISPLRSRKDITKRTTNQSKSPKPFNKTFEKVPRKVSPIVTIEREMSEKREIQHDNFTHQREEDAKKLLRELLVESAEINTLQKQSDDFSKRKKSPSGSPIPARKHKSKSPSKQFSSKPPTVIKQATSVVPALSLSFQQVDNKTTEKKAENKKPSLMAQTMMKMKKQEVKKSYETERLLRDLEKRAREISKPIDEKSVTKKIKPFTSFVRLQDPHKLRAKREHEPLTYGQQLKLHQETTVEPEPIDENELFKLLGTHRIKGHYNSYVKNTPRKAKTYAERLRELKPAQSQALIKPISSYRSNSNLSAYKNRTNTQRKTKTYGETLKELQSNNISVEIDRQAPINGRHNLQTKTRVELNKKATNKQRRFEPYKTNDLNMNDLTELDDLSSWSLDDKLKNIIYDDQPGKLPTKLKANNLKKKVVIKDTDQDTLADVDGDYLLENLLEDEKKNEKAFQIILNDLSNIEKKEKELKGESYIEDDNDYVNQVNIDDLKNISLSSESAISSFIDWDQIDNLINTLK